MVHITNLWCGSSHECMHARAPHTRTHTHTRTKCSYNFIGFKLPQILSMFKTPSSKVAYQGRSSYSREYCSLSIHFFLILTSNKTLSCLMLYLIVLHLKLMKDSMPSIPYIRWHPRGSVVTFWDTKLTCLDPRRASPGNAASQMTLLSSVGWIQGDSYLLVGGRCLFPDFLELLLCLYYYDIKKDLIDLSLFLHNSWCHVKTIAGLGISLLLTLG